MKAESLYIHFPFCESKCHYCDFYSIGREKTKTTDADFYEKALHAECELWADQLAPRLKSIFFGGGTPSMTPVESMRRALEPLKLSNKVTSETEWTMEANPSSVELESLKSYRDLGVNRVSMGVQAMRDDLLLRLGRVHSRDAALRALENISRAGFTNFSVDLLCGVPGQTIEDLSSAMEVLTSFPITHLSCYLLTLPKTHRMFRELPKDDDQLAHLLFIDEKMRSKGFRHYEISNFAKPGFEAKHNLVYWQGGSYLGLGPSAHSFSPTDRARWKNVSSLHAYGKKVGLGEKPIEWREDLTDEQLDLERWMLALRLDQGFPRTWLDSPARLQKAAGLTTAGLIEPHPEFTDRLRLTPRGFALSDQVIQTLGI
ncbi:MAG: radical SAM family heme chaperone HemW [Bdellovibrionales bacterium]|nr:radical SAM family heme chaperone HemW [Bdellovibrionales bacterium]